MSYMLLCLPQLILPYDVSKSVELFMVIVGVVDIVEGLHGCFISYIGLHGSIISSIGPYGCIICRTSMVELCTYILYVAVIVFSVK